MEFSGFFLMLINVYIVTETLVFIVLQLFIWKRVKLKKNNRKNLSQMFSKEKLKQIYRKVPMSECHLNIVTGLLL